MSKALKVPLTVSVANATAATRWVGGTASGAPSAGTWAVGDFVVDQTGKIWICTAAGTPGTWTNTTPTPASSVTAMNSFGLSSVVGTSLLYARQDHVHSTPATPVTTLTGTANQITASASTGAVTLSLPSSVIVNNLKVDTGPLDLSSATGTTAAAGTQVGDKIALYSSGANGYGFGIQAGTLVAYVPSAQKFAVRQANGTGNASSSTDIFSVTTAGVVATTSYFHGAGVGPGVAFRVGDDATINDISVANTFGVQGISNSATGGIKLGSGGPTITGTTGELALTNGRLYIPGSSDYIYLLTGSILLGPQDGTSGRLVVNAGYASSSGFIAFFSKDGHRQGYLGNSSTNVAGTDQGALQYRAVGHDFTGNIYTSGNNIIVNNGAASQLMLSNGDQAAGSWLRHDGSHMVLSTKTGSLHYGYNGGSGLAHYWQVNGSNTNVMTLDTAGVLSLGSEAVIANRRGGSTSAGTRIASGQSNITITNGNGSGTATVSPTWNAFSAAPVVVVTLGNSVGGGKVIAKVTSVSTTGCTIGIYNADGSTYANGGTLVVYWMAIGS